MTENTPTLLVTGSSGFIGKRFCEKLCSTCFFFGIDRSVSPNVSLVNDLNRLKKGMLPDSIDRVIHFAAAKTDFGLPYSDYVRDNLDATDQLLRSLDECKIKFFIHVSSVAAIDGYRLRYKDTKNCDDHYRKTKYLQEEMVRRWCEKNQIALLVVFPSAVIENRANSFSNVGRLRHLVRFLPILPGIKVKKSTTDLERFTDFLDFSLGQRLVGNVLTFELPVLTVEEILYNLCDKKKPIIQIPGLKNILSLLGSIFGFFSKLTGFDMWLTQERIQKLYSATDYTESNYDVDLDREMYMTFDSKDR
jgi:hypothetical protein